MFRDSFCCYLGFQKHSLQSIKELFIVIGYHKTKFHMPHAWFPRSLGFALYLALIASDKC